MLWCVVELNPLKINQKDKKISLVAIGRFNTIPSPGISMSYNLNKVDTNAKMAPTMAQTDKNRGVNFDLFLL